MLGQPAHNNHPAQQPMPIVVFHEQLFANRRKNHLGGFFLAEYRGTSGCECETSAITANLAGPVN